MSRCHQAILSGNNNTVKYPPFVGQNPCRHRMMVYAKLDLSHSVPEISTGIVKYNILQCYIDLPVQPFLPARDSFLSNRATFFGRSSF